MCRGFKACLGSFEKLQQFLSRKFHSWFSAVAQTLQPVAYKNSFYYLFEKHIELHDLIGNCHTNINICRYICYKKILQSDNKLYQQHTFLLRKILNFFFLSYCNLDKLSDYTCVFVLRNTPLFYNSETDCVRFKTIANVRGFLHLLGWIHDIAISVLAIYRFPNKMIRNFQVIRVKTCAAYQIRK